MGPSLGSSAGPTIQSGAVKVTEHEIDITVVVPTLGRVKDSIELHRTLHELDPGPSEIFFVFQDSLELAEFKSSTKCKRDCSIEITTQSAALARNAGLTYTRTTYIAFLDDDCVPLSVDWLANLVSPLASPEVGLVTGPVLGWTNASGRLPFLRRAFLLLPPFLEPIGKPDSEVSGKAHTVAGGNFAARTSQLKEINGFSAAFGSPSLYEETELALRLRKFYRTSIWFCSQAKVVHNQSGYGGMRTNAQVPNEAFVLDQRKILLEEVYGKSSTTNLRLMIYRSARSLKKGAIALLNVMGRRNQE